MILEKFINSLPGKEADFFFFLMFAHLFLLTALKSVISYSEMRKLRPEEVK